MDRFEVKELIIVDVDAEREEEPRVASVDEFVRAELDKVGELGVSCCNEAMDLALKLGLLFVGVRAIVFAQPRLALPILQQYVLDHVPARHEAPGSHRLHWVGGGGRRVSTNRVYDSAPPRHSLYSVYTYLHCCYVIE